MLPGWQPGLAPGVRPPHLDPRHNAPPLTSASDRELARLRMELQMEEVAAANMRQHMLFRPPEMRPSGMGMVPDPVGYPGRGARSVSPAPSQLLHDGWASPRHPPDARWPPPGSPRNLLGSSNPFGRPADCFLNQPNPFHSANAFQQPCNPFQPPNPFQPFQSANPFHHQAAAASTMGYTNPWYSASHPMSPMASAMHSHPISPMASAMHNPWHSSAAAGLTSPLPGHMKELDAPLFGPHMPHMADHVPANPHNPHSPLVGHLPRDPFFLAAARAATPPPTMLHPPVEHLAPPAHATRSMSPHPAHPHHGSVPLHVGSNDPPLFGPHAPHDVPLIPRGSPFPEPNGYHHHAPPVPHVALHFPTASLRAVDPERFRNDLLDGLVRQCGVLSKDARAVDVVLTEGSIIATLYGSRDLVETLRRRPLEQLVVQGHRAVAPGLVHPPAQRHEPTGPEAGAAATGLEVSRDDLNYLQDRLKSLERSFPDSSSPSWKNLSRESHGSKHVARETYSSKPSEFSDDRVEQGGIRSELDELYRELSRREAEDIPVAQPLAAPPPPPPMAAPMAAPIAAEHATRSLAPVMAVPPPPEASLDSGPIGTIPEASKLLECKEGASIKLTGVDPGQVVKAWYGVAGHEWTDVQGINVLQAVKWMIVGKLAVGHCEILASNEHFGDPAPGHRKELLVELERVHFDIEVAEGGTRNLVGLDLARIHDAWYGARGHEFTELRGTYVTEEVKALLSRGPTVAVSDEAFGVGRLGDGAAKTLFIRCGPALPEPPPAGPQEHDDQLVVHL